MKQLCYFLISNIVQKNAIPMFSQKWRFFPDAHITQVTDLTHLWLLRLAMSRTVCAVSEAKSRAPATGLVTVPTRPLPNPEKKPLTPPSVFTPSTVEVMMLVMPPMIPGEQAHKQRDMKLTER